MTFVVSFCFHNRNLYLDLILHSGSNVGVILLRDLIQEKQIDHFTAARLVAYAGAYVKVPSEKLLIEFQKILDMALADAADNLNVLKNAAILATARLISRACTYGSTDCQSIRIEEWQQKYFDSVKCKRKLYSIVSSICNPNQI